MDEQLPPAPSAVRAATKGARVSRSRVARTAWMSAGFMAVGVGSVGVVVPGLPTTGFFVLAAWCFSRSSPRFEQWVLDLPHIGPMVRDHRAGLGMPQRAKVLAISMMWAAVALSAWLLRERWPIAVAVVGLAVVGTWYLTRRIPTKRSDPAESR
ncbi:unannotated protein [freshwater metagenome]|uniref:Unannotated protein n=1 Tax=freshwater metagenome TaxID=449393 RepID=A0A6J6BEC8_9ZZZZ